MSTIAIRHEWESIPLRYVCQLYPSVSFNGFKEDDDITFLPMDRVKSGYFIPNTDKFFKYASSYNAFEDGDIILAKVTPCFENGNIAIAENLVGRKGFGSSELFVIRPTNIDRKFLFYYFQSSTFKQEGEASMTGAGGLKRVSPGLLRQHHLPFPKREYQRDIANYLDHETALISQAVTRGLDPDVPLKPSGLDWSGDIPAHWAIERLKYLAQVRGGLTLGKRYSTTDLVESAYLRVANVQDGYLKLDEMMTVEVPASEAKGYLLQHGDVLMNEGGDIDKLGRGCVWRQEISPCLHQNHVFAVRPFAVESEWLALWSSTLQAKRYFESRAKRATNLASISGTNIKELPVPMPPKDEQNRILDYVGKSTERMAKLQSELWQTITLLKERRSALITAAVTGQFDIDSLKLSAGEPACA